MMTTELFEHFISAISDYAIFQLDPDGHVLSWNIGAERIKGWRADEVIGQHFSRFYPPEAVAQGWPAHALRQAAADGRFEDEGWRLRKDGPRFWANVVITALRDPGGEIRGFAKVTRDLTERRQAEERLQQANLRLEKEVQLRTEELHQERDRLRTTLASIGDAVVVTDLEGKVVFMNAVAQALTGWEQAEAEGRPLPTVFRICNEQTRQPVENPVAKVLATGFVCGLANHTILIARDGSEHPIDDSAAPIRDAAGRLFGVVLVFRDITERRRADVARAWLAAIVEGCEDAVIGKALDGTITSWNPGAERQYGYTAKEAVGRNVRMLLADPGSKEMEGILARLGRGEQIARFETTRKRKDGRVLHVALRVSPVRDRSGQVVGASAIAHDITQTKLLEEQYRQAQKLEAVGRLAGGVAHDFNNLLTIINGYCEVLSATLHEHDKARALVREVHKAGERAVSLTRQLLAYSRKQILQPKVLDLNALLTDVRKMLGRLIGEDVQLLTRLGPDLHRIKADAGQVEQVVMNLAVNARDSMPQGGTLTLETGNVVLDETYAAAHSEVRPGRYVLLAVTDSGVGMDSKTQSHLFEPFFTTKELGKGTGLGLATVYGIVRQSGGHIYVYSEVGVGSTFKVYFPALPEQGEQEQPGVSARDVPVGTETVLLAEDEEGVRQLTRLLLQNCGYQVLDAAGGREALELARSHEGRIDLLITDVIMPRMSGRQLAERFAELRPGVPVLYISGYTDDAVIRHGVLQEGIRFIQKPFTLDTLARTVRAVLHGPKSSSPEGPVR